jgi:hypothetical protein
MRTIEQIKWVPYAEATHVVNGYSNNNGVLLSTARSLEEAEEYAAIYKSAGYHDVVVSEFRASKIKMFND